MKRPVLDEVMRPPTQRTWSRLIVLLLGYLRERTDIDMVAQYQCTEWGRAKSGTCLAELSALAARNFKTKRDRDTFRQRRVTVLRERLIAYKPTFAVFYGSRCRSDYETIAGGPFDRQGYRWSRSTLCAFVEHPAAHPGKRTPWWVKRGIEMRRMIEALR